MKRRLVVLLLRPSFLAAFMCGSAGSQSLTIPLPLSLPFRIDSARVVARDLALARPTDVALGPDGAVYVVDFGNTRVYKLSSDGKMLWQFGHAGDGPGEFRLPTRLAVGSDNSVLVWDAASEQVTRVDSTGGFVGRQFLHVDFATVDNILGLAGGRWLFTGVSHHQFVFDSFCVAKQLLQCILFYLLY